MKEIETKLLEIVKEFTEIENPSLTMKIKEDLSLDSLSVTEFIIACEDEFNIEIDMDHPMTSEAKTLFDIYKGVCFLLSVPFTDQS